MLFSLDVLREAATRVHQVQPPTAQYCWPLLSEYLGSEVWVKHENHTATGAFKVRGGITFMHWLQTHHSKCRGIITATRGNHGQSQAKAATAAGLSATILVPQGNSVEKNAAMRAFGGEVIEHGVDFDEARVKAEQLAAERGLFLVPSYHDHITLGVASYALELMANVADIDRIYVPIGCGSGICGLLAVRDAMGLKTEIIGVVSTAAPAAKLSFDAGKMISTDTAKTFADGMAVRVPVEQAFNYYSKGASRVVSVTDDEVAAAIRLYYTATHNMAEGAGAAPLAAAMQEREQLKGKRVAVILCGGNIDTDWFVQVMRGETPQVK
ncbi:threonine dehydratase [Alteromonas sp. ASW11-36]|uniref:Threonine dehydratase n=1 Tax=Alteromonas arenosi TaxID=3055817 RepID=A0ABT7T1D6_9ALTE|nr:threonine dehydratase [Alteromonas sp. ASW11-36]MDM7862250.1 threonine dehydratase [Alteromonas sp. ASW11-36]